MNNYIVCGAENIEDIYFCIKIQIDFKYHHCKYIRGLTSVLTHSLTISSSFVIGYAKLLTVNVDVKPALNAQITNAPKDDIIAFLFLQLANVIVI